MPWSKPVVLEALLYLCLRKNRAREKDSEASVINTSVSVAEALPSSRPHDVRPEPAQYSARTRGSAAGSVQRSRPPLAVSLGPVPRSVQPRGAVGGQRRPSAPSRAVGVAPRRHAASAASRRAADNSTTSRATAVTSRRPVPTESPTAAVAECEAPAHTV